LCTRGTLADAVMQWCGGAEAESDCVVMGITRCRDRSTNRSGLLLGSSVVAERGGRRKRSEPDEVGWSLVLCVEHIVSAAHYRTLSLLSQETGGTRRCATRIGGCALADAI